MLERLRNDMCSLEPDLPLVRREWRERKYNPLTEEWEVISMCPLCTLAVKQGLVTMDEVNMAGDIGDTIREAIESKYDIGVEDISAFITRWDSIYAVSSDVLTVERACSVIDGIISDNTAEDEREPDALP